MLDSEMCISCVRGKQPPVWQQVLDHLSLGGHPHTARTGMRRRKTDDDDLSMSPAAETRGMSSVRRKNRCSRWRSIRVSCTYDDSVPHILRQLVPDDAATNFVS